MIDKDVSDPLELLRHQTTLARFGEFALRSEDLDLILVEACRLVGDALGTDLAKVLELRADHTLLVRAGVGWQPGVVGMVNIPTDEKTAAGYALKTGQPVISPDIAFERRFYYPSFITDHGVKAVVNVIIVGGAGQPPFGVLQVDSREPREFTSGDITFLRSYANLIAAAVDRLRVIVTLREGEARLARALDANQLGAWDLDLASGTAIATPRYNQILGLTDTPVSWRFSDFLDRVVDEDRARVAEAFTHAQHEGTDLRVRCRILRAADGQIRWIEARGRPEGDEKNPRARLLGILTDISEPKQLEEQLIRANDTLEILVAERTRALTEANKKVRAESEDRARVEAALHQSQKMEAVGHLTGGLAHDFNNLLQAISSSVELMQRRVNEGHFGGLDRYLKIAKAASDRGASLIHSLLAFSRRQTLDPQPTSLNRLVGGMADLFRSTLGPSIIFKMKLCPELPSTLCDSHQLDSALLNLVVNARDAMPEGGSLLIETAITTLPDRRSPQADQALRELPPGTYLTLSVTDTGVGMDADVISRAFDPFFTTKPIGQGTGLGLSMVYGFVRQSGGHVQIQSKPGAGSRVTIFLQPHATAPATEAQVASAIVMMPPRSATVILLVEDEAAVRTLVSEILTEAGFTVLEAEDARSALQVFSQGIRIDILLSDVGLPGAMNGRHLADAVRRQYGQIPVLFITGYAASAAVGNGSMAEGMDVITKPLLMNDLIEKVRLMTAANSRTEVTSSDA